MLRREEAATFLARLHARRAQLEEAILTRVYGIDDPSGHVDRQYSEGLRLAVSAALDYGLEAIELAGRRRPPAIPPQLLVQARLAARNRVSLDTVLRRYCGGNALFTDALVEEIEGTELPRSELRHLLLSQTANFDRLLAAVSEEYELELRAHPPGGDQRRVELVERLLAGELLDASELSYNLGAWHVGLVAAGSGCTEAIRRLAAGLDRALLLVERQGSIAWAWLGSGRPQRLGDPELQDKGAWPSQIALAIGEPAQGVPGWRLSHRQAAAALPIALRETGSISHYADAPLVAAALQDDLLATSLRQLYIEPLDTDRSGLAIKDTLGAYFAARNKTSSAAAALGVSRGTVGSRLAAAEEKIGRPIDSISAEIQTALRLDEIEGPQSNHGDQADA